MCSVVLCVRAGVLGSGGKRFCTSLRQPVMTAAYLLCPPIVLPSICRDVVSDTVHQFAPAYHDYVLYSDGGSKPVPPKTGALIRHGLGAGAGRLVVLCSDWGSQPVLPKTGVLGFGWLVVALG